MDIKNINELFGISESFMLPERLMTLLFTDEIYGIYEKYAEMQGDLSYDGFTEYFQEEHSSRKAMMQDFTPRELTELVGRLAGTDAESCLDVCAGTGGLTIALHSIAPKCIFFCEELSRRALPLLLFNLAVRNISAYVTNKDVLSGEVFGCYEVVPGKRFGSVRSIYSVPDTEVDVCITNPPYSLKWEYNEKQHDPRFDEYGYPPKQFSDMGFIIHGMSRLKYSGRIVAILPHGVLFRGNKEADIRRRMAERGSIHAVIGLPDKLFQNTNIPVAVVIFGREHADRVVFIDGSKGFEKDSKYNRLRDKDIEKIIDTVGSCAEVPKYSHIAGINEIIENDYNLNISRYVDTYEPPPPVDIVAVTKELATIKRDIAVLYAEIQASIMQLRARDSRTAAELEEVKKIFAEMLENEQVRTDKAV